MTKPNPKTFRLSFAPYNPDEKRRDRRGSFIVFETLRRAMRETEEKPTNATKLSSWRANLEVRTALGDLESIREEPVKGISNGQFITDKMEIVVLKPDGGFVDVSEAGRDWLKTTVEKWIEKHGNDSLGLEIALTLQWFEESVTEVKPVEEQGTAGA